MCDTLTIFEECRACEGSGRELEWARAADGSEGAYETGRTCRWCKGRGEIEVESEPVEEGWPDDE